MDESLLRIEGWPDRSGRSKLQNPFALRYRYFPATACPATGFRADGHRPSCGASRRASAFMPIEIGLLRRLCAKRRPSPTQGMFFSVGAGRPMAEGLGAD
jgi:hypothetical protein